MWWGACMVGDMHGRGVHGREACVVGGHAWQGACMVGGVHGRGVCVAGGHAWQGACMMGVCMPCMPPHAGTTAMVYDQSAGGTHNTGMHSCSILR